MMSFHHHTYSNQLAIPNIPSSSSELPPVAGANKLSNGNGRGESSSSSNEKVKAAGASKSTNGKRNHEAELPSSPKKKRRKAGQKKGPPSSSSPPHRELGPYDIICGRSSTAFNNVGNRRFRVTMSLNLNQYIEAPTRQDKSLMILSIAKTIQVDQGGRFLKKAKTGEYVEVDDKQIRDKIGHALRDLASAAAEARNKRSEGERRKEENQGNEQEPEVDQACHASLGQLLGEHYQPSSDVDEDATLDPFPISSMSWGGHC